ncbi:MAG: M14/M99 family metallopeptidase [Thermodesulfobacteriota bacterium]|nr:M14/M99 family metallopeptidase [Thermodesulfobacteriota bacterium]
MNKRFFKAGTDFYWYGAALLMAMLMACNAMAADRQKSKHDVYFENTDYELHVYRVFGRTEGKTLMLIGGIQGNEPGGFLSADLYVDLCLAKGNLIIVPRANFQSIVQNRRQVNKDMNRTFSGGAKEEGYEFKIVSILKKLIAESDCLLNLHDGSGFYSPEWESDMRNPMRYGQSIIADCDSYMHKKSGRTIELGEMARAVIGDINKHIKNPDHYFHFNNHKTGQVDSLHKEQRGSATYYAVTHCGIPAFGIETNKNLSLAEKVSQHNFAINAFMERLDIIPETPGIYFDRPELQYLLISINNSPPALVANHQTLYVKKGDTLRVAHIEANYKRGLSADFIGEGTYNDLGKNIKVTQSSKILVKKDFFSCGTIHIELGENRRNVAQGISVIDSDDLLSPIFFKVTINGDTRFFPNYGHVDLVRGDLFKLVDVVGTHNGDFYDLTVNFKGFVGDRANNTGEDRGYDIHTGKDLWERYSLDGKGHKYQVVVTKNEETVGKLFVFLNQPVMKYVLFQAGGQSIGGSAGEMFCCKSGDALSLDHTATDFLKVVDVITNVHNNTGVNVFVRFDGSDKEYICGDAIFDISRMVETSHHGTAGGAPSSCSLVVRRGEDVMGNVVLNFTGGKESG